MEEVLTVEPGTAATSSFEPGPQPPDPPHIAETETAAQTMSGLESRALNATLWTVLDYGAGQGLRVVNSIILTHMLLPAAFGEMTLVMTLIVGLTLLSDFGLQPSIIQSKRGDDPTFLNTAWTLQAARGLAIWLFSLALAIPAARFYNDPQLLKVLPVLGLTMVLSGFNSTGLLTLSRHMGVRRLFGIDFSTQILSLIVTVTWAYFQPSVWALVAGTIAANLFRLTLSHWHAVVPGLRNSFCFDRESFREIFHFGKWIVLGTAFYFFASQSDRLILGRFISMTDLGIYGLAYQISDVPRSIINALSQKVGFPFISRIIDLPMPEFRKRFLHYRRLALLLGAALLSVMSVWGGFIILKVYPARYAEASWMIPILALGLWQTLLYTTTSPVLFSLGKSGYNAVGNAAYAVTMILGIPLAFHFFGLFGAVVAVAAGDLPLYIVFQYGATREGIKPLWQDAQMTLAFLALLALNLGVRSAL